MFNPDKETTSFAFILYRCAIAFRNELNKEFYKEFGEELTTDYWFILSSLWEEDNVSHNILAERVSRDKASLSRTLDIMEQKGLIKRLSVDDDRRGSKIALTRKSYEIRDKATLLAMNFTQNEFNGLSPIEVKELVRMLNQVFNNLKHS
ncbi:MAG: MarR family winged helix-turn-helix transcriptional regulator [Tenuifilaceae bacterium]